MPNDTENIQLILEAVDQASVAIDKVNRALRKNTELTDKQNESATRSDQIQQRLGRIYSENEKVFQRGALAAAAFSAAYVAIGKSAINAADEASKLGQRIGLTTEQTSTLIAAANEADVSIQGLQTAFKEQAKAAVESTKANTAGAEAYRQLGISAEDTQGNLKAPLALFLETAEALSKVEDANLRSAIAQNIFGRGALEILPLIKDGAAGITDLQARYKSFGLQISTETGKQAESFNDQLSQLGAIARGAAQQTALALLPALRSVNDFLISNSRSVQLTIQAFAALAIGVTVAATAFKALAISGQLAASALGLGAVKGARDFAAAIQLAAGTSLGPIVIGVAAVTAAVLIGVEAWRAYTAAKKEAESVTSLNEAQLEFRKRIEDQIVVQQRLGRITVEEADRMGKALETAFESGNAELKARSIESVSRALREAQGIASQASTQSAGTIALVDSPELTKVKTEAALTVVRAGIKLEEAERQRTAATEDRDLQVQLRNRLITVEQFEAKRLEITDQRQKAEIDAAQKGFDLERSALQEQQRLAGQRLNTLTPQERLADPGAADRLTQQKVSIDAQIEALETEHQARLQSIRAGAEATTAQIEQEGVDLRRQRLAQESQLASQSLQTSADILEGQAKQKESEAQLIDLLNRRAETEASVTESANLRLEAVKLQQQAQIDAENAAFEQKRAQTEQSLASESEKNLLLEEAERLHQENLATIREQASVRQQEIEAQSSDKILAIKQQNIEKTASLFGNLASLTADQSKKGFSAFKAFASAEALINTYRAVQSVIAGITAGTGGFGFALAIAQGAVALATGLANVAKINSIGFAEGGLVPGAPSRRDNRTIRVATGEYIFDSESVRWAGPAFFADLHDQIRRRSLGGMPATSRPRNVFGFADGGLVGDAAGVADSGAQSLSVTLVQANTRNEIREVIAKEGLAIIAGGLEQRGNTVNV